MISSCHLQPSSFPLISSALLLSLLISRFQIVSNYLSLIFFILLLLFYSEWSRKSLPPGPFPLPLIGNMYLLATGSFDDRLQGWRKTYGEVFTVWIGPIPLVMVCSLDKMRRFFVERAHEFSNRWRNHVTDTFMGGDFGVVQIDGEKWREQRRFALQTMRDLGVGRSSMEEVILNETSLLMDFISSSSHPLSIGTPVAVCVGNVICKLLFGKTFQQGSSEMESLHSLLDAQSELVVHPLMGLYISLPFSTSIPLLNAPWKQLIRQRNTLWSLLQTQVQEHIKVFESGSYEPDLTFRYLEEIKRREEEGRDMGSFSEWQLTMLLLDLLFAGMETTVTTLKWAFLLMAMYPETQAEVQRELDSTSEEEIRLEDRKNLPFTQATIYEIQRVANILPINLLRTTSGRVIEGDWIFPRNTLVIPQISVLLSDPSVWDSPSLFQPRRFLDSAGGVKRIPEFIPFSIGKRQCLGESLARAELFLIFTNVLKRFRVVGGGGLSRERRLGLTVSPLPFSLTLHSRKHDSNDNSIPQL